MNKLEDIVKQKLYHAEMDLPDGDWDVFAKKMSTETKKRRRISAMWWVAAAMLTGFCISIAVLFNNSPLNDIQNLTAEMQETVILPSQQEALQTTEHSAKLEQPTLKSSPKTHLASVSAEKTVDETVVEKAQKTEKSAVKEEPTLKKEEIPITVKEEQTETVVVTDNFAPNQVPVDEKTAAVLAEQPKLTPEEAEKMLNDVDKSFKTTETASEQNSFTAWSLGVTSSSALFNNTQNKTTGNVNPIGGGPVGVNRTQRKAHYDMPVTVGLSVGVALIPRLDILTGINYTYLSTKFSDISEGTDLIDEKQQCHYLGIPLMLSYRFVDKRIVKCYTSIGGMGEKGLIRKTEAYTYSPEGDLVDAIPSESSIDGMQWSLTANVGVAVTLYKGLNIYFEPGFTWYIPNSSHPQPETMRTKNPYNLSLTLGLRFNFDKTKTTNK